MSERKLLALPVKKDYSIIPLECLPGIPKKRKDKNMSLAEHLENAEDLAIAAHYLMRVFERTHKHFGKSHPAMKLLYKLCPVRWAGAWSYLQSELSILFHQAVSIADFRAHGHIYYNLEDRYEALVTKSRES